MSSMMQHFNQGDAGRDAAVPRAIEEESALRTFTLKRTGKRPLRFQGWQIIQATGYSAAASVSYDINIYETLAGNFVAELLAHRDAVAERDVVRVEVFDSLDDTAKWLEAFSPAADLPVAPGIVNGKTPLAVAALQVVQLRQCLFGIEDEYRALVSEVLDGLDLAEPPAAHGHGGSAAMAAAE